MSIYLNAYWLQPWNLIIKKNQQCVNVFSFEGVQKTI